MGTRARSGLLALVLAALVVLAGAAPASAHASLLHTDPHNGQVLATAPGRVTFTFDEQIRLQPDAVHAYDAAGHELDARAHTNNDVLDVDLPHGLARGTYIVVWRVISEDGHPVDGSLTFSVGARSAHVANPASLTPSTPLSIDIALAVVQALVYIGLFLCVGLIVFELFMLPAADGLAGVRTRLRRIEYVAAAVSVVAVFVQIPVNEGYQAGSGLATAMDPAHWSLQPGDSIVWAALALAAGLVACLRIPREDDGRPGVAALGGVLIALASLALVGHTRSAGPHALVIVADVAHVVAGSTWLGGLVGLTITLRRVPARIGAAALARFSTIAAWTLGFLAVTGTILAWRILGSWKALVDSDFGITLLIKVGVVCVVVVLAAVNRFRLLPSGDDAEVSVHLRRTVRVEAALLLVVLAITAVLVDRSPLVAPGTASGPVGPAVGRAAGVRVAVRATPGAIGANAVTVRLRRPDGSVLVPYSTPTVSFARGDLDLGDQPVRKVAPGTYRVRAVLPKAGTWTASVAVRTSRFDSQVVPVRFTIGD